MSQPTRSTSPFAGPDPTTTPTVAAGEPVTTRIVAIMAGVQRLYDQVAVPGVQLHDTQISADGLSVMLTAHSIEALSSWYDAHGMRSASVVSRLERRADGRLYGLGGLDWMLSLGPIADGVRVCVRTTTTERQKLPDTALVRAMCPWEKRLQEIKAREIAHYAHRSGVAA